jgi:hypothetical protein
MPTTTEGKAVSSRNATTHGLFCRQTVLPHLGEDPQGYENMFASLLEGLDPRTLMERQYLELWADASWKLRRLSRWEAQLWEADTPDEDALLAKLERLSRLQTTLRRQLDKAVRMLGGQDVPSLYAQRARRAILADKGWTEVDCRTDHEMARTVEAEVLTSLAYGDRLHGLDKTRLDSAPDPADALDPADAPETQICQNEPSAPTDTPPRWNDTQNCQNELQNCQNELPADADNASAAQKPSLTPLPPPPSPVPFAGDTPFRRSADLPRRPYALKM